MAKDHIRYKGGYKYVLQEEYLIEVKVFPDNDIDIALLRLDRKGNLIIRQFYAWDGPSGPALDRPNFMRGSLVHDALYQLMRMQKISKKRWRKAADQELRRICREDGMNRFKAWGVYNALRRFGGSAADPSSRKDPKTAP